MCFWVGWGREEWGTKRRNGLGSSESFIGSQHARSGSYCSQYAVNGVLAEAEVYSAMFASDPVLQLVNIQAAKLNCLSEKFVRRSSKDIFSSLVFFQVIALCPLCPSCIRGWIKMFTAVGRCWAAVEGKKGKTGATDNTRHFYSRTLTVCLSQKAGGVPEPQAATS